MNEKSKKTRPVSGLRRFCGLPRAMLYIGVLCSTMSCAPGADDGGVFWADFTPPTLLKAGPTNSRSLRFEFDEDVTSDSCVYTISPDLGVESLSAEGSILTIVHQEEQVWGRDYTVRLSVEDQSSNTLSCLHRFTGWNPSVPQIVINEFNPRGSSNTPDAVELRVLSDGNLAGMRLYIGTEDHHSGFFTFPFIDVSSEDYIVIYAKSPPSSSLSNSTSTFEIPDTPGIPGNNGVLSLYNREGGTIVDAVIWTDREERDDDYRGWTATVFPMAQDLQDAGVWFHTGGSLSPKDAIPVSSSTATRSLNRWSSGEDTDSHGDWHVVPTRGQSFGSPNSDAIYEP